MAAARSAELLPVRISTSSLHCRMSFSTLVLQNKRLLYDCSYRTSAATMLELARDPKHLEPTSDSSACCILGQTSSIIPCPLHRSGWRPGSRRFQMDRFLATLFLPVYALSRVFRGKFCEQLNQLFQQKVCSSTAHSNNLPHRAHLATTSGNSARRTGGLRQATFGGAEHVLNYLARYTHRVAISSHRLVAFQNDRVSFRWRLCPRRQREVMTVSADEFLRRFLLHVLPGGLVRIRHFGLFANAGGVLRSTAAALCSA